MRVLVTGATGQVGQELEHTCPGGVDLAAFSRAELDITRAAEVEDAIGRESPDVIVNAAAYTAVDRAEAEEDVAYAVNASGASHLAAAARAAGCRLVHLSTDFVFDGSRPRAWRPDDEPRPLSAYGRTKLAGEKAVQSIAGRQALVVRTSWVYSRHGRSFVTTMLDLMASRSELAVVCDQIGCPTWARSLARAIWRLAGEPEAHGVLHWSDAGVASWYDFAVAIQETALDLGLLEREIPIAPITTAEYPTPAERPAFSVLDASATRRLADLSPAHWRHALWEMLADLASERETARA